MKKQQKIGVLSTLVLLAIGSFGVPQNGWASVSPDTISADGTTIKIGTNSLGEGTQYTISAITGDVAESNTGLVTGGMVWTYLHQEKLALGSGSTAAGEYATALGVSDTATIGATAVGYKNTAKSYGSALGYNNFAVGGVSTALGRENVVSGAFSVAIGDKNIVGSATVTKDESGHISGITEYGDNVTGEDSYVFGVANTIKAVGSFVFGAGNKLLERDETYNFVIGSANNFAAKNAFVIGSGITTVADNSVVIGNGSSSEDENTVSVGAAAKVVEDTTGTGTGTEIPEVTRRIVHVAAGTTSSDAATYGQLIAAKDGGYQVASTDANTAQSVELEYNDGASNATKVKITVAGDGEVASGDKRLVDGGTVYDAIAESLAQSGYTGSDTITINTAKQISVKNMTQGTDGSLSLGSQAEASGQGALAVGAGAKATGSGAVAFGATSKAQASNASAIGVDNYAYTYQTTAIGYKNKAGDAQGTVSNFATAIGSENTAVGYYNVAIGGNNTATGTMVASAVGLSNTASGSGAAAYGTMNTASQKGAVAMGMMNTASGQYASALGGYNTAAGENSTATGQEVKVYGTNSASFGYQNTVGAATTENDETVIDPEKGNNSYVFGAGNTVTANNALVLGSNVTTVADSSVVIGNGSTSEDENTVSVGSAALQRKIVHVAAGTVNTDVATYGQLIAAKDGGYQVASTDANTAQSVELEYNDGASNATKVKITVAGDGEVASGDKRLVDGGTVYDAIAESLAQSGYTGSDTITINTAKQISVKNMTQGTDGSLSLGSQAEASGQGALAVGAGAKATGEKTSVFGSANIVNGKQSTAVGYDNSLTGTQSVAVGTENKVTNSGSATVGYQNWNYGYASSVYGSGNYTIGDYSTAIGYGNGAYGADSSAVGYGNAAMAEKSAAFGSDNEARGKNSIAVGVGNIVTAAQSMAFGYNSYAGTGAEGTADATGAVAIGNAAVNTETGTVSFGHKKDDFTGLYSWTYEGKKYYGSVKDDYYNTPETYDSDQFARLTNVADGIDNHDVATYGQLVNAQAIKDDSGNVTGYTAYELKAGEETEIKNNAGGTAFKLKLAMASGEIASGDGGYVTGGDIYQELRPADSGTYNYIGKTKEGGTKYTTADNLIALDSQVKTNADAIGTINTNVTTLTGDVSTLKRDVSTMKTNVETLTGDVSTLKTDVSDIKGSITDMSTKIEGSKLDGGEYVFSRNDNSKAIQYANQGGTAFTITIKGLGEGGGANYDAGNGIAINDDKISVNLAEKSGLSASESGLAVKVAENGGLTVDDNGLAVQKDGKIESGNTGIVTGGTVYDAISSQTGDATRLSAAGLGDNLTDSVLTVNDRVGNLSNNINKVGAGAAALAALHPESYDPADKWSFAVGYGHYKNANAGALGAFFKPNADTTLSVGGTIGNGDSMMNAGISFKLGSRSDKGVYRDAVAVSQELASLRKHTDQLTADNQILKKDNLMQAQKIANLEANNERMQRQIQMILSQLQMSNRVARTAR